MMPAILFYFSDSLKTGCHRVISFSKRVLRIIYWSANAVPSIPKIKRTSGNHKETIHKLNKEILFSLYSRSDQRTDPSCHHHMFGFKYYYSSMWPPTKHLTDRSTIELRTLSHWTWRPAHAGLVLKNEDLTCEHCVKKYLVSTQPIIRCQMIHCILVCKAKTWIQDVSPHV